MLYTYITKNLTLETFIHVILLFYVLFLISIILINKLKQLSNLTKLFKSIKFKQILSFFKPFFIFQFLLLGIKRKKKKLLLSINREQRKKKKKMNIFSVLIVSPSSLSFITSKQTLQRGRAWNTTILCFWIFRLGFFQ